MCCKGKYNLDSAMDQIKFAWIYNVTQLTADWQIPFPNYGNPILLVFHPVGNFHELWIFL